MISNESDSRLADADERDRDRDRAVELAQIDALAGVASFGFGMIDLDLRFVRVNRVFAAMNALAVEQHRGRPVADVLPELWPQLEPALERMLRSGKGVCTREYVGTRPAAPDRVGSWLHTFHPVHVDGELVGIGFVVLDVTAQRQSDKLRAVIMQTMAEGLVTFDGDGRLTLMNAAAERLLGWTEDELRGSHLQDLVHRHRTAPGVTATTAGPLAGAIRERRAVQEVEDSFVRRDGRVLPVVCSAAPEPSGGVVIVFSDATERIEQRRRAAGKLDAITWVARIREALDEDRLELYSQPILPLAGGALREELFLRMITRDGEVVPAGAFIAAADELGVIVEIDRWVISRAVRCAALGRLVHVNLSATSVADPGLLDFVAGQLRVVGALASNLVLEVTEAALMSDAVAAERFATGVQTLGCGLALDDFGTGSGSFAYLERVAVQALKIDRDFVRDLPTNVANQHLVQAIVALARRFGHATIAGGVEDKRTLTLLRDYGVDYAQGYDISQPAPVSAPRGERRPAPIKAAPRPGDDRARLLRGRLLDYREARHGNAEPEGLVWRAASAPARR
ncbi:MAG: EAL domain-containing protein [Solirubrobacteraceae bacterium]|nr:EAL domain-containing protein [Solirubrobacteraceae bacterium]